MKIRYEMEKGFRVKSMRGFRGIEPNRPCKKVWWREKEKCWHEDPKGPCATWAPCRTFKAARRHVRKYGEVGVWYTLMSYWKGYDILIKK